MTDVDRLIFEAWDKVWPQLKENPHELQKRLARRRSATLTRPMRHWCLAIRASDRRITPAHWVITPQHAMDLNHPAHPYEPIEHEVLIGPHALRKYIRPVRLDDWGEEVTDVAKMLGCHRTALQNARHAAQFTERSVRGLAGKKGHLVPILHTRRLLDPSSGRFFSAPDPICGQFWQYLADYIPDNFEQPIMRRPVFHHPANIPEDHRYKDDAKFWGWRWVCPACNKPVRTIYYPVSIPRPAFLNRDIFLNKQERQQFSAYQLNEPRLEDLSHPDLPTRPPPSFACRQCHQVQSFSSVSPASWNTLIGHLTAGLLFGHEVQKPAWYQPIRKHRRSRHLNRRSPRRDQVLRRLLNGWSTARIARDLMMRYQNVNANIRMLCQHENVPDRHALAAKLGATTPPPLNPVERAAKRRLLVTEMLLAGHTCIEIAKKLDADITAIRTDVKKIYLRHGIIRAGFHSRRVLAAKLAREIPPTPMDLLRQQIHTLLQAGLLTKQIAKKLKANYYVVYQEVARIRKWSGPTPPLSPATLQPAPALEQSSPR